MWETLPKMKIIVHKRSKVNFENKIWFSFTYFNNDAEKESFNMENLACYHP